MRILVQRLQFVLMCILILSCSPSNEKKYYSIKYDNCDFSALDTLINSWISQDFYSGAGIVISTRDSVLYKKFYGTYDSSTVVYIASAGKWLAAATISAIVDEGKLNWNDKVDKWLPEFKDIKGKATIRQLFSHTSGYPDYQPKDKHSDNYQTLEESVSHIYDLPADTFPGTVFHYGGLAMQVAGRIAELAYGKDFEYIFQEKICRPLGMTHTCFTPVDSSPGHNPMLGGGARTTLNDYNRFLKMIFNEGLYNGKRILSKEGIKELQTDNVLGAKIVTPDYVEKVRALNHNGVYGLGEWREELDTDGNAVLISSPSWAGAYPWIDKTTGIYGFFLTHVNVESANKEGFSSFYASPVIPLWVRDILKVSNLPDSVKTDFASVNGTRLYYQEAGKGEPLIFIHGHSFDHTEWEPQFTEFAKHFRTIVYDVRGYGRSASQIEGQQFMHVEDLVAFMDYLGVEKAHIVGLSMGGFIATDMLAKYQDRLLSATLASGDLRNVPGPDQPWTDELILKERGKIENLKAEGLMTYKWNWLHGLVKNGGPIAKKIEPKLWEMIYRWNLWQPTHVEARVTYGRQAEILIMNQVISVPVMVLTGEVDYKGKRKLHECIPSAIQKIVPDAGHVSNLENPEAFNRLIMQFIKRND
ncbi:alpha/beta fold hydrolase [Saccharicrinis sp. FJH62]|uniref:alpha/beta fold hydrolase n=1 Tax=Saccharicrinis sp. FJH62 TaxID=3344657 RepID=UPI0035D3F109